MNTLTTNQGIKVCTRCLNLQPYSSFSLCARAKDGLQWWCKTCRKETARNWRQTEIYRQKKKEYNRKFSKTKVGKEIARKANLHHTCKKMGITLEFYDALPKRCNFPDCGAAEPGGRGKVWHKDHDHLTGKFRSLLCHKHNRQVSDLTLAEALRLVEYLQRYS